MREGVSKHSIISMISNIESFIGEMLDEKNFRYSFKFPSNLIKKVEVRKELY